MNGLGIKFDFDEYASAGDEVEPMDIDDDDDNDQRPIRQTRNRMTRFEKARILGARATLLAKGAQPLVSTEGETDPLKIAEKELRAKVLPMSITRKLPDGSIEEWVVKDLRLPFE